MSDKKRNSQFAPKEKCSKCGEEYTLGVDGTVKGCDNCTGTSRATNGFAVDEVECICLEYVGDNGDCPTHGKGKK